MIASAGSKASRFPIRFPTDAEMNDLRKQKGSIVATQHNYFGACSCPFVEL